MDTKDYEARKIALEGVENARQLGGIICADGRRIRENVLIRTGALRNATDRDVRRLADKFHVTKIFDFRMRSEHETAPDRAIPGAENIWIEVLRRSAVRVDVPEEWRADGTRMLIEYAIQLMPTLYENILLSPEGQAGYARFFREVLAQSDGAILWHCTQGKDRAGVASVLMLLALGADAETALDDFDLSNIAYAEYTEEMVRAAAAYGYSATDQAAVRGLTGVNREYMNAALAAVKTRYGSVTDYLRNAFSVTDAQIEILRDRYLV